MVSRPEAATLATMDCRYICSISVLALALGCGDDGPSTGDETSAASASGDTTAGTSPSTTTTTDGSGSGSGSTGPTSQTSSTGPSADSSGSSGEPTGGPDDGSLGMGHGTVRLVFERAQSETEDPFVDTAQIEITLLYLECLVGFYQDNPDWSQLGPQGAVVFDAALGSGVCDPDNGFIDCTVAGIDQELDMASQLTVRYDVSQPIEDQSLRFGPLPVQELADCQPVVRVPNGGIVGRNAMGDVIWQMESFNPQEAATDQQAPITIRAARL